MRAFFIYHATFQKFSDYRLRKQSNYHEKSLAITPTLSFCIF